VLTLRDDRTLEPPHLLHGPTGAVRGVLGGEAGADEGLDVLGGGTALDGDLELPEARAVPPGRRQQLVVDGEGEPPPVVVAEDQMGAVVVDADDAQICHGMLRSGVGRS
jgi:hypothetical protein